MKLITVPITQARYFDTHLHSVKHGPGEMSNFALKDVYKLVDACASKNINSVCLTEHMPLPDISYDPTVYRDCGLTYAQCKDVLVNRREDIKQYAQKKNIAVYIGGEYDYFTGQNSYYAKLEECIRPEIKILGLHFIDTIRVENKENGKDVFDERLEKPEVKQFCFDYSNVAFQEGVKQRGARTLVRRYFELMQQALVSQSYDTLAHIDLINKWNISNRYFEEDSEYKDWVLETLDIVKRRNVALEVNLGGVYCMKRLVPRRWILKKAQEMLIPITIGSDTHGGDELRPETWDFVYTELKNLGITEIAIPLKF